MKQSKGRWKAKGNERIVNQRHEAAVVIVRDLLTHRKLVAHRATSPAATTCVCSQRVLTCCFLLEF